MWPGSRVNTVLSSSIISLQHRNEDTDSGAAPVRKSLEFQEITSMSSAPDVSEGCARVRRDVYAHRWNAMFQRSGYAVSATVPARPARRGDQTQMAKALRRTLIAWSKEDVKALRAFAKAKLSGPQTAKKLRRTPGAVAQKAMKLGVHFQTKEALAALRHAAIRTCRLKTLEQRKLAKQQADICGDLAHSMCGRIQIEQSGKVVVQQSLRLGATVHLQRRCRHW
jgi:hypothetical protein